MKRLSALLFIITSITFTYQARAQDGLDKFLEESIQDGEKLIGGYISPLMKSLSVGMNQSWYNTAKPHKIAGFDLTASVSLMYIPDAEILFDANKIGLTDIVLVDPLTGLPKNNGNIPTIFGPDTPPTFSPNNALSIGNPLDDFDGPGGVDLEAEIKRNAIPVPMAQFSFGLPKGTEIKFRFIPKIEVGDGQFNLFGIGVMHDVKQHIPGIKDLPFDLSALIGYTKLKLDVPFDDAQPDQKGLFEVKSTTIQGLISKKLSVVTFYGGLGYNIAKSNLALLGTYDIGSSQIKDPLDLKFKASGFRATAGMRLKLAVFTFSADYTLQKYKALTLGFGISVR